MIVFRFDVGQHDPGLRQHGLDLIEQRIAASDLQGLAGPGERGGEMVSHMSADRTLDQMKSRRYASVRLARDQRRLDLGAVGRGADRARHAA